MRLHRVISIVLFAILAGTMAQAQSPATASQRPEFSDEPYVFERYRNRVQFENDGSMRREMSARVRVQSQAGVQRLGQLIFGYGSAHEKMEVEYVRVRRADGSIVSAGPDAVQDLPGTLVREAPVYSDFREKHITVPGLRAGDTLEYSLVITLHTPLVPEHFWLEYAFEKNAIVLGEELEINVPRNRDVKLKTKPGLDPKTTTEGDRRIYRWTSANREANADGGPDKKKRGSKPEQPDIQLTTLHNWDELGRWYAELERERVAPTAAVRAKAQELVQGRATELEKIEALYDFVAQNFRYISLSFGVGRYQPHAAEQVLGNWYGDCKDKHTLLASLLESVGIKAQAALINTGRDLDPDLPAPSQFNHMITAIPQRDGYLWLDTTAEVAPFRMLSMNLRKKKALVVARDGSAKVVETPADLPFPNSQVVEIEGKVSELGKLEAKVRHKLRGDNELALRLAFRHTPSSHWKNLAQTLHLFYRLRGEVADVKVADPGATKEAFWVEYETVEPNYLDWSSRRSQTEVYLPVFGLREPDMERSGPEGTLELDPAFETLARLKLGLPAKFTARAPIAVAMTRDYGTYRSNYKVEGNTLVAERALAVKVSELPQERAGDYAAFRRAVRADEAQTLSLEAAVAGTPSIPESAKVEDLYESGVAALRNQKFELAADLLKRVTTLEPKHKQAWINLGRAYQAMQRTDDAIVAYRKQLEVNPYDEWAHNHLGSVYWRQQKYERAAEAFRKQLEINPLDEFAYGSLGSMYCEWRKYAEAVPLLEKAVSLKPDNAPYHVSLGEAYLNLNQPDKALESFDRAVEILPVPGIWNNVAYELSRHKAHLDRAQRYAESAIAATAASLRNVTLERLRAEDLGQVSAIGSFWDTLGWIHFQNGDLEQAERFIRAAWELTQHGEVGHHLGQVYDRRGNKEQAVRAYAMALAASRPPMETRQRLAALIGSDKKVDALVEQARRELAGTRTLKLGALVNESAEAEFFVLLAPGSKVEAVKFIRGSEKLRTFTGTLQASNFGTTFPDATPTKLVRRGVLSCTTTATGCSFVLLTPDDVHSVN